jgi:transcriptional regulator with XRE-family HTH domain
VDQNLYRCNLHVTGEQLRAARAMARIEQSELAMAGKVSVDTIKRLERTIGPVSANVVTLNAVVQVLEAAGVEFTNGDQPGVRMRRARDANCATKTGRDV